jgi:hypothetical protein
VKHPFRIEIEKGAGREEFAKLFARDVVVYAPMLTKPVRGLDQVLKVVGHAAKVVGNIQYSLEVNDGKQCILLWNGKVEGFNLEAVTIFVDGKEGLIREMRVLMPSWPVVTLFRNAMHKELSSVILTDYGGLGPKPVPGKRVFTPIAMKSIEMAPYIELHSPILARSVKGKAAVDAALRLAHSVQTASSYTSTIATPELLIELFECDANGYPMEGLWVSRLNEDGQISDLTVYLRPYPAVTVLRDKAKGLAEKTEELSFLRDGYYWELSRSD